MDLFSHPLRRLKYEASYVWHRTALSRLVATSSDAYATHTPILIGVAALTSPRRILELGSGKFSTPTLNDPALFPTAEHIHTMEDDAEWADIVRALPLDPARSCFELVPSIRDRLSEMDLSSHDLIFVDNAVSTAERAATLRIVLDRARADAVIVMHDFEWRAYRAEVGGDWRFYTFTAWKPHTGVIWKGERLAKSQLAALQRIMRVNRANSPAKAEYWRDRIFAHLAGKQPVANG